jgi:anion-transporting  ArsA/GET3 family ATPase
MNKIYFVLGKGGVGKTFTSVLLARYLASCKQKVLIVECNGAQHISEYFGATSQGYRIQEVQPDISTISINPMEAIEDYIIKQLKFKKLFQLIFQNRMVQPLIEGSPGLHDAVQLGKIYDLSIQQNKYNTTWDSIIVDAPSTGHGTTLLSAAKTMMNLTKVGPLYENNRIVEEVISQRSEIILVTLPEELPCQETLQLYKTIREDFQSKIKLLCINRYQTIPNTLGNPSHILLEKEALEIFPQHSAILKQWQYELIEQQSWQQWLKSNLHIPHTIIPHILSKEFDIPEQFAKDWEAR